MGVNFTPPTSLEVSPVVGVIQPTTPTWQQQDTKWLNNTHNSSRLTLSFSTEHMKMAGPLYVRIWLFDASIMVVNVHDAG